MIAGHCTSEGTAAYAAARAGLPAGHWRDAAACRVGSMGLGSYLGAWDDATDKRYAAAVVRAVEAGINVIDTAVNYRFQRSERALGRGLAKVLGAGGVTRESVLVCTKGGYIPFEGAPPDDPDAWIEEHIVKPGVASADDIVDGHCMSPSYLKNQIDVSRRNLGLETIDVYYVHNPEHQRGLGEDVFYGRLERAFAALEECAAAGKIQWYGTATWHGYRVPAGAPNGLSLARVLECARKAGGEGHRFRFVQLPFNLQFLEALTMSNQGGAGLLEAARAAGVTVFTSVPLMQGRLVGRLASEWHGRFPGLTTDAQRLVQFARSAPGVTAPMVGMSRLEHVEEMARLAEVPPMERAMFDAFFA